MPVWDWGTGKTKSTENSQNKRIQEVGNYGVRFRNSKLNIRNKNNAPPCSLLKIKRLQTIGASFTAFTVRVKSSFISLISASES